MEYYELGLTVDLLDPASRDVGGKISAQRPAAAGLYDGGRIDGNSLDMLAQEVLHHLLFGSFRQLA